MANLKGNMETLAGNMAALQEMERLRQIFDDAQIPILFLKGAAYQDTLYEDLSQRSMCDIDFLIHENDKNKLSALLENEDYERVVHHNRPAFTDYLTEFS